MMADEDGQGLIEYSLLLTAVALLSVGVLSLMGVQVSQLVCQTAQTFGNDMACGQVRLSDDFEEGVDEWSIFNGHDDDWLVTEGDDPRLCYQGKGGDLLLANKSNGSDYVVSANANLDSGQAYGIFFRATINENQQVEGYSFTYDPGYKGGRLLIQKWVNGYEIHPPIASTYPPKNFDWRDVDRHVEIDVTGNQFTASIDGEQVLVGNDDTYSEGSAGLRLWNGAKACFDNFSVNSP